MYKMIGGVGRRESGCNSAIGKEAGKERPGRQDGVTTEKAQGY